MTYRYPGGLVRRTAANTAITGASGVWDLGSQAQAVRNNTWPISGLANPISGSLRFRASASAWLNRTFGTPTLSTKWTYSGWFKLSSLTGTNKIIFDGGSPDTRLVLQDISNGPEQLVVGNDTTTFLATSALYRDYSAWYHAVLAFDSSQGTASNRLRLYINGSEVTAFATDNRSSISGAIGINTATAHGIGKQPAGGVAYFDGYMAEVNFIDGQQLTPASFGQTSAITGVWEPIKYTGTYGNNGFYLSLSDTSSIGKDFSGNGNNWTPNNISTSNDSTFDLMRDVPTQYTPQGATDIGGTVRGNYATLNPIDAYDNAPTQGNLARIGVGHTGSPWSTCRGTMGVTSGKWYFEATLTGSSGSYQSNSMVGVMTAATSALNDAYGGSTSRSYQANGGLQGDNSTGSVSSAVSGDVIMCAFDIDAGKVWFGKNGTWFNSGVPASGTGNVFTSVPASPVVPAVHMYGNTGDNNGWYLNFGQRPFAYTPPSGFKSLCTTNLPTPTIGATTATAAGKYFNAVIWTGTGGTRSITGVGFQPDFVWAKARSQAYSNILFDSNRGVGKNLLTDTTYAEATNEANGYISSFDADGFSSNFSAAANYYFNESSTTYVAWNWNAGGSTVTNTAGSISAQVRANQTAGFSIVTYTGNGTSGATVGHGLGVAPSMYIVKVRSTTESWITYHTSIGATNYLALNLTQASSAATGAWNNTAPTSTVFSLGNASSTNGSGSTFVAYCFAQVAGYSAFGSYTGNGSSDGPFIYTGFKPRFVIIKRTDAVQQWWITDTARNPSNTCNLDLFANLANAEENNGYNLDLLSNGVKIRTSTNDRNASSGTYIYAAFAEHPFKNSLAR